MAEIEVRATTYVRVRIGQRSRMAAIQDQAKQRRQACLQGAALTLMLWAMTLLIMVLGR